MTKHSFDIEMPLDVDDEFWQTLDPEKAFKQPSDRPSLISYFNSFLKLNQILAFALRTIVRILLQLYIAHLMPVSLSTRSTNPRSCWALLDLNGNSISWPSWIRRSTNG